MPYNRGIDSAKLDEILEKLGAPSQNAVLNTDMRDVIGNRSDINETSTIAGRVFDQWEEAHQGQWVYPLLANAIQVTAAVAAWALGSYATIIPANAISDIFHIHHICICSAGTIGSYELRLYSGAGVRLAIITFAVTDKKDDPEGLDLHTMHLPANSAVRAKLASGNGTADALGVKLWYHLHES